MRFPTSWSTESVPANRTRFVAFDDAMSGEIAADDLISCGHGRIGFVSVHGSGHADRLREGILRSFAKARLMPDSWTRSA